MNHVASRDPMVSSLKPKGTCLNRTDSEDEGDGQEPHFGPPWPRNVVLGHPPHPPEAVRSKVGKKSRLTLSEVWNSKVKVFSVNTPLLSRQAVSTYF